MQGMLNSLGVSSTMTKSSEASKVRVPAAAFGAVGCVGGVRGIFGGLARSFRPSLGVLVVFAESLGVLVVFA